MPKYILYRWGPRGPQIAVVNSKALDEWDRSRKLTEPVELKPEEESLSLKELEQLYPPPERKD